MSYASTSITKKRGTKRTQRVLIICAPQSFMVLYLDKEGLILHANDHFLKKSNWTPKRIVGKSFWQLFPNTSEHIAVADGIINSIQKGNTYQGTVEKMPMQ